jgi:hypothetical protein
MLPAVVEFTVAVELVCDGGEPQSITERNCGGHILVPLQKIASSLSLLQHWTSGMVHCPLGSHVELVAFGWKDGKQEYSAKSPTHDDVHVLSVSFTTGGTPQSIAEKEPSFYCKYFVRVVNIAQGSTMNN